MSLVMPNITPPNHNSANTKSHLTSPTLSTGSRSSSDSTSNGIMATASNIRTNPIHLLLPPLSQSHLFNDYTTRNNFISSVSTSHSISFSSDSPPPPQLNTEVSPKLIDNASSGTSSSSSSSSSTGTDTGGAAAASTVTATTNFVPRSIPDPSNSSNSSTNSSNQFLLPPLNNYTSPAPSPSSLISDGSTAVNISPSLLPAPTLTGRIQSHSSMASPPQPIPSQISDRRHSVPKRSRQGCLTCRARKRKCCETKPICKECERLGIKCQWWSQEQRSLLNKNRSRKKSKDFIKADEVYDEELKMIVKVVRAKVDYKIQDGKLIQGSASNLGLLEPADEDDDDCR